MRVLAVSDVNRANLRDFLVLNYDSLSQKLASRLGPSENAREILHETYLHLAKATPAEDIRSPGDYLFRIALNVAANRRRAEARRLTSSEVDALLDIADDSPDPCRVAEARSELRALESALGELPQRRRAIFVAAVVHKVPRKNIAKRYGVSVRTIDFEVRRALEHGARRLNEILAPTRFESGPPESSTD
ncbi:MAG: RNA polymerase sigma factor [Pseudomonadota bacterium]